MMWITRQRSEGPGGLAYWCAGTGAPLVAIHGVGLRAESWAAMMPSLSAQFCVYALDMPGHGGSAQGDVRQLEDYVDLMQEFIDTLGGPVFLLGHSMGAILGMKLAARMGDGVAGLAALNAVHRRNTAASMAVRARAKAIADGSVTDPGPTLERWFGQSPKGALKAAAAACDGWLRGMERDGYARAYTAFATQDGSSDAELHAITCPALFMTGQGDSNSTPAMSRAMAAAAPRGRAEVIAEAAHMMPMTHPEAVTAAIATTFRPREAHS